MQKMFFSFTFTFALCFTSFAQQKVSTSSAIMSSKWYVKGAIDGKSLTLNKVDNASDWEAKFSSTGNMSKCATAKTTFVDPTGVDVKSGTFYCDSMYSYKIKGNMININYPPANWYYKITTLPNNAGYQLDPANVADFK